MTEKSRTCFNKHGEPVTVYRSVYEAIEGANYANHKHGMNLCPYQCSKCGLWHLSPKNRQTPSKHCSHCNKELYDTREAAENRAMIIRQERGIVLRV